VIDRSTGTRCDGRHGPAEIVARGVLLEGRRRTQDSQLEGRLDSARVERKTRGAQGQERTSLTPFLRLLTQSPTAEPGRSATDSRRKLKLDGLRLRPALLSGGGTRFVLAFFWPETSSVDRPASWRGDTRKAAGLLFIASRGRVGWAGEGGEGAGTGGVEDASSRQRRGAREGSGGRSIERGCSMRVDRTVVRRERVSGWLARGEPGRRRTRPSAHAARPATSPWERNRQPRVPSASDRSDLQEWAVRAKGFDSGIHGRAGWRRQGSR
jgi:hypothetical protein